MNADLYEKMIARAGEAIRQMTAASPRPVRLVSGGAAWSDHVAVRLYLSDEVAYEALTLHLPCPLLSGAFLDKGGAADWKSNPGRSSNRYHTEFSAAVGRSSLAEIRAAVAKGATLKVHDGFFKRNSAVAAESDALIAFSWSRGDRPDDGGTKDTWDKAKCKKVHISLHELCK